MSEDYRVNDLQSSLERTGERMTRTEAELVLCRDRSEMLERLYRDMIRERYAASDKAKEIINVGNGLVDFLVPRVACSCRRDWVCHKCQIIAEWKEVCGD